MQAVYDLVDLFIHPRNMCRYIACARDIEGHTRHMAMGLLISVKSRKKQISVFLFTISGG